MTLAAQVTSTGIVAPDYADILAELTLQYQNIFGSDVVVTPDSQDGQFLAIFSQAIYDSNQLAVAVFNSFSPAKAVGAGLASVVKINGIKKEIASNSTAPVTLVGQAGTPINNGLVGDENGNKWALPISVTIPIGGSLDETATCLTLGAVQAPSGTINRILTPTRGWQSVVSTGDAAPGAPVESDATLRQRQSQSTALPSETVLDGIYGVIANLPSVQEVVVYENDTDTTDGNGIPSHSISAVVIGGNTDDIANAIALKKAPGTGTYGTTSVIVLDPKGVPNTIRFYQCSLERTRVTITGTALPGYVSTTDAIIKAAIALFINELGIGTDSYLTRLYAPATLSGDAATDSSGLTQQQLDALSKTFNITAVAQAIYPSSPTAANITIAFNQAATCDVADVTVNIT